MSIPRRIALLVTCFCLDCPIAPATEPSVVRGNGAAAASTTQASSKPGLFSSDRLAVPPATELAPKDRLIATLFARELSDNSSVGRQVLALKLLDLARQTPHDPAGRYAMLVKARDLAADSGGVKTAFLAVGELDDAYDVDGPAMLGRTMSKVATKVTPDNQQYAVDYGTKAITVLMVAQRFDDAAAVCGLVQAGLPSANDAETKAAAGQLIARTRAAAEAYRPVKAAFDILSKNADDAAANDLVGRFMLAFGSDTPKALACLAKGPTRPATPWRDLASREVAGPSGAAACAELASGWWDLAQGQPEPYKQRIESHAIVWYRKALPGLTGLSRTLAERRIASQPSEVAGAVASVSQPGQRPGRLPTAGAAATVGSNGASIVILSARWGGGSHWADVTPKVQELYAKSGSLWASASALASDPTPGWRKKLEITYERSGQKKTIHVDEGKHVTEASFGD